LKRETVRHSVRHENKKTNIPALEPVRPKIHGKKICTWIQQKNRSSKGTTQEGKCLPFH